VSDKTGKTVILAAIIGLAAVGILGYSTPKEKRDEPLRVLYKSKGGPVVFDHKAHSGPDGYVASCDACHHLRKRVVYTTESGAVTFDHEAHSISPEYGLGCTDCHHEQELELDSRIQECGECHQPGSDHNASFDEAGRIHRTAAGVKCADCHRMRLTFEADEGPVVFDHHAHATSDDYDLECSECHHKPGAGTGAKTPRCDLCHLEGSKTNKSFEDADVHTHSVGAKCGECHDDEIDDESCEFCHREEPSGSKTADADKEDEKAGSFYQSCAFCHKAEVVNRDVAAIENCDECHGMSEKHDPAAGPEDPDFGESSGFTLSERKAKGPHPGLGAICAQCHEDLMDDCGICHTTY